MKTTAQDFAAYKRWQKYILGTRAGIPKDCKRPTLIAYALAMAVHGTNGRGCFASDTALASELGLSRETVGKYRSLAIQLGWFTWNGKRHGRVKDLDISVPAAPEPMSAAEHVWGVLPDCPACRPLLAKVSSGEMTISEVRELHSEAIDAAESGLSVAGLNRATGSG